MIPSTVFHSPLARIKRTPQTTMSAQGKERERERELLVS